MRPSTVFVELDKKIHNRKSFDCGNEALNVFLIRFAARHREAGISLTMVLPAQENEADICAYYTLSHTEIERKTLSVPFAKKLPHYPIPVLLLAQLAVDHTLQGQGLGKLTLIRALRHCYEINAHLPSYAVVLDLIGEGVQHFYVQYGFQSLEVRKGRTRLFLPMKTVEALFI